METRDKQTAVVTACCVILGCVLGLSLSAVLSDTPLKWVQQDGRADWLGFWGSIIGSAMTITAAGVAFALAQRELRQQQWDLRVNTLDRARERAERDVPGIRKAIDYVEPIRAVLTCDFYSYPQRCYAIADYITGKVDLSDLYEYFEHMDFHNPTELWDVEKRRIIEENLSDVPGHIRDHLIIALMAMCDAPNMRDFGREMDFSMEEEKIFEEVWEVFRKDALQHVEQIYSAHFEAMRRIRQASDEIAKLLDQHS